MTKKEPRLLKRAPRFADPGYQMNMGNMSGEDVGEIYLRRYNDFVKRNGNKINIETSVIGGTHHATVTARESARSSIAHYYKDNKIRYKPTRKEENKVPPWPHPKSFQWGSAGGGSGYPGPAPFEYEITMYVRNGRSLEEVGHGQVYGYRGIRVFKRKVRASTEYFYRGKKKTRWIKFAIKKTSKRYGDSWRKKKTGK